MSEVILSKNSFFEGVRGNLKERFLGELQSGVLVSILEFNCDPRALFVSRLFHEATLVLFERETHIIREDEVLRTIVNVDFLEEEQVIPTTIIALKALKVFNADFALSITQEKIESFFSGFLKRKAREFVLSIAVTANFSTCSSSFFLPGRHKINGIPKDFWTFQEGRFKFCEDVFNAKNDEFFVELLTARDRECLACRSIFLFKRAVDDRLGFSAFPKALSMKKKYENSSLVHEDVFAKGRLFYIAEHMGHFFFS